MKILLTGSGGQLAACFLSSPQIIRLGIEFLKYKRECLDIRNIDSVANAVSSSRPDVIVNCAAYANVEKAENEWSIARETNSLGALNLAKVASDWGILFVHFSTDYVFDGEKVGPYSETDSPRPLSKYGSSKLEGENLIQKNIEKHIIVRTSWLFSEFGKNFFKTMVERFHLGKSVNVVDDQTGSPTYGPHLAKHILNVLYKLKVGQTDPKYGVFHYSDLPSCTWRDFAEKILTQYNSFSPLKSPSVVSPAKTTDFNFVALRPKNSVLDCKKIERLYSVKQDDWIGAIARALPVVMKELEMK